MVRYQGEVCAFRWFKEKNTRVIGQGVMSSEARHNPVDTEGHGGPAQAPATYEQQRDKIYLCTI